MAIPIIAEHNRSRAKIVHDWPDLNNYLANLEDYLAQIVDDGSSGTDRVRDPVADIAELKAVPSDERTDRDQRLVASKNANYGFNAASSDPGDDDLIVEPDSGAGRWFKLGGATGATLFKTEVFTPGAGQTVFTLAVEYIVTAPIWVFVNGTSYNITTDFTASGTTLTWLDNEYALDGNDTLKVIYGII